MKKGDENSGEVEDRELQDESSLEISGDRKLQRFLNSKPVRQIGMLRQGGWSTGSLRKWRPAGWALFVGIFKKRGESLAEVNEAGGVKGVERGNRVEKIS